MKESIILFTIKLFGCIVRFLPLRMSLGLGKVVGIMAYYFDARHKSLAYANLKMAFAEAKSSDDIKRITKKLFINYGRNIIELLRMPLINPKRFEQLVEIEGKENVSNALSQGNGVILLAMHFGSWEIASLSCAMLGYPYKVIVKPQTKYSRLDDLLNSYRECGGSVIISRGIGTRDLIKGLKNNEVVGMVVDQGGKDGVLVPFFNRQASMSVGAIRLAIKLNVPICFAVIVRKDRGRHKMIIHKPFDIEQSEDHANNLTKNLNKVVKIMEKYISDYPSEYMWFYKIWKYSDETNITLLSDGKVGHLRQSQSVAAQIQRALARRNIRSTVQIIDIRFKSKLVAKLFSILSLILPPFLYQGRLGFLKHILRDQSYQSIASVKTDFVVSCGSSLAGINTQLSKDHNAKSICMLKPGILNVNRFDLVILPYHDVTERLRQNSKIVVTAGAPNIITPSYLEEQSNLLLNRYSHLKNRCRQKIGVFIGGNSKNIFISEPQIRAVVRQLKNLAAMINADILLTTSRRTPVRIEQIISNELKKDPCCPLLILANQDNVREAVGGILGLSDIVIVSGDSISMISEAITAGKDTVVFYAQQKHSFSLGKNKHKKFIHNLASQGFVLPCEAKDIGRIVCDVAKNKIKTKPINDNETLFQAVKEVI